MERRLWHSIGLFLLISNTVGIIALIESIIYKIPYFTIFLLIFGLIIFMNLKLFKKIHN
ncbi:MAG: hypothetical protein AAB859_01755 [Patescibacteria group bacterium]